MKLALAYALLLLFCSWPLAAADTPAAADIPDRTLQAALSEPALCSMGGVQGIGIPKPLLKGSLPPPCIAYTDCPGGGSVECPVSYYTSCWWSEGCWVMCEDASIRFCPGREGAPGCEVW
jgi:hypothetical protein